MENLNDYKQEQLTIDLVKANLFSLVILIPTILLFGLPYYLTWHNEMDIANLKGFFEKNGIGNVFYVSFVVILGIVIHELIHGLTWSLFAKNGFKSMKFGVLWKMLTPYCHCKEPLKVKHYIWGAIAPAIILGFIPAIISIFIGNMGLLIFGMFFTFAATGDFMIINLLKTENGDDFVQDHPSEAGCFIYRKELSN